MASTPGPLTSEVMTPASYRARIVELEAQLVEANETLDAIRLGEVDAVVVSGANGPRIYTLENADRPYRTLIEQMQEGAVMLLDNADILYCNEALAHILEVPLQALLGNSLQTYLPPHQIEAFRQLLTEGGRGEIEMTTWSGKAVCAYFSFNEIPSQGGRIFCGVITDLTRHKFQLQELAESNQRLQKEISEREQTEQRLYQAQKMEAVGQLTGGLAHDFNNLLTVILGNLQLASSRFSEGNEKLTRYLDNAIAATQRGSKLTQQLLAFSRKQSLKTEVIQFHDLMPGIEMLARQVIGVNIEFRYIPSHNLWHCQTDANQLESAILNLVINARDAISKGGMVSIASENILLDEYAAYAIPEGYAGKFVKISVADTGTGMPPEVLERVFEPFFTTKGVGKGSGLGLSMVYGFVRQSNGFVNIESTPGEGTQVSLFLPYADPLLTSSNLGLTSLQRYSEHTATVLVVEDDPDILELVKQLVEDMGLSVLTAKNAQDALKTLEYSHEVDLVFTDIVMPGEMSGIDLARQIRCTHPEVPVILTSGFTEQTLESDPQTGEALQILRKPYHYKDLASSIRTTLERQSFRRKAS